jgi:N-acetylmuramoyl-L-alanine amidase
MAAVALAGGLFGALAPAAGAAAGPGGQQRTMLGSLPAPGIAVLDARLGLHPDHTRFVLELSGAPGFTAASAAPNQVQVDLPGARWGLVRPPAGRGAIRAVRVEATGPGLRITLDGAGAIHVVSAQMLPPLEGKPPRLVIDVAAGAPAPGAMPSLPLAAPPPPAPLSRPPAAVPPGAVLSASAASAPVAVPADVLSARPESVSVASVPPVPPAPVATATPAALSTPVAARPALLESPGPVKPAALRPPAEPKLPARPLIVLDPGHGGVDPGAVAVNGSFEKDITLAMARELKKQLEATGRYRVVLTRDSDVFVPLRERPGKARTLGADLFVSLHADSHEGGDVRGLSVYTLSDTASDREAAMLASRENRADALAGMNLSSESDQVASILIDLAQRDTMNQSHRFAATLLHEAERETALLARPQRSAGFAVLTAPDVPAVLVELGYLSHPQDVRLLSSRQHQRRLAGGIVRAIDGFFGRQQAASRS